MAVSISRPLYILINRKRINENNGNNTVAIVKQVSKKFHGYPR